MSSPSWAISNAPKAAATDATAELEAFCQAKKAPPQFEFIELSGAVKCRASILGFEHFAESIGGNRALASKQAIRTLVSKLHAEGLMNFLKTKAQRRHEEEEAAAKKEPSWAIQGGTDTKILEDEAWKDHVPKKRKLAQEKAAANAIQRELGQMHDFLRQGCPKKALSIAKMKLAREAVPVKAYTSLMHSVALRSPENEVLDFLSGMLECEMVKFPDEASARYYGRFCRWALREFVTQAKSCLEQVGRTPSTVLQRTGVCVQELVASKGKGGTELNLDGNLPELHSFQRHDWLFLTFPHNGAVMPTLEHGPPGPGNPRTYEAELLTFLPYPPGGMVVRVADVGEKAVLALIGKKCRVDRAANKVTFSRQADSLRKLCGPQDDVNNFSWLRQVLLTADEHRQTGVGVEAFLCQQLRGSGGELPKDTRLMEHANPSQKAALQAALSQQLTLIQGPPGAGKTSTALLLVKLLLMNGRGPILCSAESNIAVDNLLRGCVQAELKVCRVGRAEVSSEELEEYNLMEMVKALGGNQEQEYQSWKDWKDAWKREREILKTMDVVCCTCSGAAQAVMKDMEFETILIDEAAQATELAVLVPLVAMSRNGSVTLVGDHKQLPPTVSSIESEVEGYSRSLFERLALHGVPPFMLDVQYRMHPAIAAYSAQTWYDAKLRTGVVGSARPAPRGIKWPIPGVPIIFLHVEGSENPEGSSFINPMEVDALQTLVYAALNGGDVAPNEIGIITPYAAQARLVRRELGCSAPGKRREEEKGKGKGKSKGKVAGPLSPVEVSSVDGFQGREKDLILVSCVRANVRGSTGFVGDPRRLNVMFTRARRGIIICGHFETLSTEKDGWRPWLSWAQERGLVAGCPPTNEAACKALQQLNDFSHAELLDAKLIKKCVMDGHEDALGEARSDAFFAATAAQSGPAP